MSPDFKIKSCGLLPCSCLVPYSLVLRFSRVGYHSTFVLWQNEVLENSVKSLTDELQDVRAERDVFQQKAHRLNVEMNHIVGNEEIRILDIDALCMENRSASPSED